MGDFLDDWRGPFTLEQARAEGFDLSDVRRMARAGYIRRLRAAVYVSTADLAAASSDPALLHALHVRGLQTSFKTPVVAAAASAAQIYGLEFLDPPHQELVVMTGDLTVSGTHRDGYRLRVAQLPDHHVTELHGVRLTTPARTIVDLCAELSFVGGVVVAESAVRKGLVTVGELGETAEWPAFRRGIVKVRRVIDFLDPASESPLESASRATFPEIGIRVPKTQVWLVVGGVRIRVDFFWDDVLVVGEADGFGKYQAAPGEDPLAAIRREKSREQLVLEDGLEVVRWGWREVRNPALLQRRLAAALARGAERQRGRGA
ncbi:type IV toxin-antitoxin system AbiEi family antitoxin [Sporichthya sp.]|uniref:type IV toxin-antitoxin system AbiEi family antitoxin n=1 Tax=Sporichthya sp. TaxID=65475 RepID=UPI0017B8D67C|nr:type IV toxin-antitoxin system AbiEi family antitoxin [Sporichthya sp.]MBA3745084.1 hypothetical protein [Sporichthya sp.]